MKTTKILMKIAIFLALLGLNEAIGQWITNGNDIYNAN
jgi:hypothetical protein